MFWQKKHRRDDPILQKIDLIRSLNGARFECYYNRFEHLWHVSSDAYYSASARELDEALDKVIKLLVQSVNADRVRLKYVEKRQISVTRTTEFGRLEQLVGGYDLDNDEKVESFLQELKDQLLTGRRTTLYGESDEYHNNYGYRSYDGDHYDYTPCCDPAHKTCWHACASGKFYSCSDKGHCHVVDCGHMTKSSGHKRENEGEL